MSMVATIWLAATLAFFALRLIPEDAIAAQLVGSGASPSTIEQRRHLQGLDAPILSQYVDFLLKLLCGDLGHSLNNSLPVTELIAQQFQPTVVLATLALVIGSILGVMLGVGAGIGQGGGLVTVCRVLITLALSTPIYWTGTLVLIGFSWLIRWSIAAPSPDFPVLLPASLLGFHTAGAIARLIETNIGQIKEADFLRTAYAKGLPKNIIVYRHMLRVGLLPVLSAIGLQAGFLLGGTVIVESIFVRPGIGRLLLDSTLQLDYPVVQGIVILAAVIYTGLNTLIAMLYPLIDPRLRYA